MNPMKIDEKHIYAGILVLVVIVMSIAFSEEALSENAYKNLLALNIGAGQLELIKAGVVLITIASSLVLYYTAREQNNITFITTILFLFSPIIFLNLSVADSVYSLGVIFLATLSAYIFLKGTKMQKYGAIIPIFLALYISSNFLDTSFSLEKIKEIGIILPLSIISILAIYRDKIDYETLFFIPGLLCAPLLPALSLVFVSLSAGNALQSIAKKNDETIGIACIGGALASYLVFNPSTENYLYALAAGIALGITSYFIISLFNKSHSKFLSAVILFVISLGFVYTLFTTQNTIATIPTLDELALFKTAAHLKGTVGILESNNAFEFYTGQKPYLITTDDLLKREPLPFDYALFTVNGLSKKLSSRAIIFRQVQLIEQESGYVLDYLSNAYVMRVFMTNKFEIATDAILQNLQTETQGRTVSFPKLKRFSTRSSSGAPMALINTENILESNLYDLLFTNPVIEEYTEAKIVKSR